MFHETTCPRIKAIEYEGDGVTVKRIEFHDPNRPWFDHVPTAPRPPWWPPYSLTFGGGMSGIGPN
jgi:hypothetical protein